MTTTAPVERVGKRSGNIQFEHLQKESFQRQLDGVIDRVNESLSGFKYDRKSLSTILAGLQQFMETALGINATQKPFPKIPAKLFRDYSPDGPLFTISRLCAELMKKKNQKRIDFVSPATRKDNADLVLRIRQELLRAGFLRHPRVYVQPDCPNASILRHAITKMGGELAHAEGAPGVTHVVFPYGPNGDPDDGQEYLRTLEVSGGAAFVHWWYLPDSYDEWVPAAAAPDEPEPDLKPPGGRPWKVYVRWVADSEKYNEWMNEADYETEASVAENKRAREAGEGEEEAERDRKKSKKGPAAEVAAGVLENIAPGAATRRVVLPNERSMEGGRAVVDISSGQRQKWQGPPVACPPPNGAGITRQEHQLPLRAAWFDFDNIHEIEKSEFGEFLKDPRTPELYKSYRNAIIDKYLEDPRKQLCFLDITRFIEGDSQDVRKIYDFLSRWGMINWRPQGIAPPVDGGGNTAPIGAPSLLKLKSMPTAAEGAESLITGSHRVTLKPGAIRRATPQLPAAAISAKIYCNVHPWEECTALRYHCTKKPDIDICPAAYAEGRFPPGLSAKDFVRIGAGEGIRDTHSRWSDQETLLLLEAMEVCGDDWDTVAERVGGRTTIECIERFLRLPIDDTIVPLLTNAGTTGNKVLDVAAADDSMDTGKLFAEPLPFEDTNNPVMATVGFLSTVISGKVGAAAAQKALEILAQDLPEDEEAEESEISDERMREATQAALVAAAARAQLMAEAEEREMQRLIMAAVDAQMKKIMLKMQKVEKMDLLLKEERQVSVQRAQQAAKAFEMLMKEEGEGIVNVLVNNPMAIISGMVPMMPPAVPPVPPLPVAGAVSDKANNAS